MTTRNLRPSTIRSGEGYLGALRLGRRVVWSCDHQHRNRDESTGTMSAIDCARTALKVGRGTFTAADVTAEPKHLTGYNGWQAAYRRVELELVEQREELAQLAEAHPYIPNPKPCRCSVCGSRFATIDEQAACYQSHR